MNLVLSKPNVNTAKPITHLAVLCAMYAYLDCQRNVTTLEVKNLLRAKGYDARQAEVSRMVETVARDLRLGFRHDYSGNKVFKVYHF